MEHVIDVHLLDKRVEIHLIGVGGNGAQMATCLARLDIAMKALGHPYGLHVTAFDADRVSEANVGRQLYKSRRRGALQGGGDAASTEPVLRAGLGRAALPLRGRRTQ